MASLDGDRNSLRDSFDYFDEFLKSRSSGEVKEDVEEEIVEEVVDETDDSSSSYYEEEIVEDSLVSNPLRLHTLHEIDVSSEDDEDISESDAFWEDYSESFHSPGNNSETGGTTEALNTNSDMIARVRDILRENKVDQGESSLVDSSSQCGSLSEEGGGSSSVLPFDFDMGSDGDGELNSSDEDEDIPEDYEAACRAMIATVHPNLDPCTMLHGCDLRHLYNNLKQQYGHVIKSTPEARDADSSIAEPMKEEPIVTEDEDANNFVELSFKSHCESHGDMLSPEPIVNNSKVEGANNSSVAENSNNASGLGNLFGSEQVSTTTPAEVEKWLERNANDPEDPEYVCRLLCALMYDQNNPDYDVETMLQRSTALDLYRYLKHQYWYLAHSNQLDENGVYISKDIQEGEEKEPNGGHIEVDNPKTKSGEGHPPSGNVDSLRSFFANRAEMPEHTKVRKEEVRSESTNEKTEIHEEEASDHCDQPFVMDLNESNEDAGSHSDNDEIEVEMQSSKDKNESLIMEESPLHAPKTSHDHSATCDNSENNSELSRESHGQHRPNDSIASSSSNESTVHMMVNEIDKNEPCSDESYGSFDETEESVERRTDESSLSCSTRREEIDFSESYSDGSSDNFEDTEEPTQQKLDLDTTILNTSSNGPSIENESSVHSLGEDIDPSEAGSDGSSDNFDNNEEPAQQNPILNTTSINTSEGPSTENESSVHSLGENIDPSEAGSNGSSDNFDNKEEPAQQRPVPDTSSLNDSSERSSIENESSVHSLGEDIDPSKASSNGSSDYFDNNEEPAQQNPILNTTSINTSEGPSTENESSVHSLGENIDPSEAGSNGSSDNFDNKEEPAQQRPVPDTSSLNDSSERSSTENESSVHSLGEDIDPSEASSNGSSDNFDNNEEPAQQRPVPHTSSLNDSSERSSIENESSVHSLGEDIDPSEASSDGSSDDFDKNEEPAQQRPVPHTSSLNDSSERSSIENEISLHSSGEMRFLKEPCNDGSSDNFDDNEKSKSLNYSAEKFSTEEVCSAHSSGGEINIDEPCIRPNDNFDNAAGLVQGSTNQRSLGGSTVSSSAEPIAARIGTAEIDVNESYSDIQSDNFDGNEESVPNNTVQNDPNDSMVSAYAERDSLAHTGREDIDMTESLNDSCGSLWEQYSRKYDDMLARKKNDEDIDENRLRLLDLSVKYIRGERLTEDEVGDVEDFFDQQTVEEESERSTEICLNKDSESGVLPFGDSINSQQLGEENDSGRALKPSQDTRSDVHMSRKGGRSALIDPKELEWRKTKIKKDLRSIIKETEVAELRRPLSSEIVAALNAGSLKTALTKKYYDSRLRDFKYYPSIAESLQNFSLIEEAEKVFCNEFSFELSTALCTIAASRIKGNDDEVNENQISIKEATVNLVLDESFHQNTIEFSNSFDANGKNPGQESPAEVFFEERVRGKRIKNDLESIIKDAEENHLGDKIQDEATDALLRAANEIVFIKKYYDVDTDIFKYFPSVKNTVLNCSLMERAEDFYFDGVQDFPLDYSSALRASAARFLADFVEVDALDDYVIKMAVDVDIDDELEENQSKKYRDYSTTNDTASMMSSQTTECHSTHEQKILNDDNELEDMKPIDMGGASEEANKQKDDYGIAEAELDEKESVLMGKYLDDRRSIDEMLVVLESELVAELDRLDNEKTECRLKHKIEAERIEKDRRGVEENALADENNMTEQTKMLLEKLSAASAVLESERKNVSMDTVETEKDESKSWGWFNNKTRKNNAYMERQKQGRLMNFYLREVDLEKDIAGIKAQLGFVEQQAKAKKRSTSEWKAELDEEYRHLEALTSATEEKLEEEMGHLQASYDEERRRLLNEKNVLDEIRSEKDKWIVSERGKIGDTYESQRRIPRAETEYDRTEENENDEEVHVDEKISCFHQDFGKKSDKSNVTTKDDLPEPSKSSVPGENMHFAGKHIDMLSNTEDGVMRETTTDVWCEEDDYIQSNTTGSVKENFNGEMSAERDGEPLLVSTTSYEDENSSLKNGNSLVPDHLAALNQPHVAVEEVSLESFEMFDLEEADEISSRNLADSDRKDKSEEDPETKQNEQETRAVNDHTASQDPPKELQDKLLLESHVTLNLPKGNELSDKRFLAAALKGKQKAHSAGEAETVLTSEESANCIPRSPGKSLHDMRRKVEEALERAMDIRNGESSSRHSRGISVENGSDESGRQESLSALPLSPSQKPVNPIYPMIRETDRLSGFIRRYEKKLQTVCKSLLTLASVTRDEKEILAARNLDLPEMLEFVVNQDWYKAHSMDTESDTPHLLFSKLKNGTKGDSASDSRYSITATGKSFLEIDGPVPSDVSRFLTYLNKIEDGLTRDSMLAQWTEIAQLSGDEQSQRLCDKLDKLISFCVDSQMIKK